MNARRGNRRRVGSLIALVLAAAIGAGGTAGVYQAFAANPGHSQAPVLQRIAPAGSRIGSNENPSGDCSGLARAGTPFPC